MPRSINLNLTTDEANELFIAAAEALADSELLASGADDDALSRGLEKLASARPKRRLRFHRPPRRASIALVSLSVVALWLIPYFDARSEAAPSPFEDPAYRATALAIGWHCEPAARLLIECATPEGFSVTVEALAGPAGVYGQSFVCTYAERGTPHRNVFKVLGDPDTVVKVAAEAQEHPELYPNFYAGPDWVLYGTDGPRLTMAALALQSPPTTHPCAVLR